MATREIRDEYGRDTGEKMDSVDILRCPVCYADSFRNLRVIDHRGISKCLSCGHLFASKYSPDVLAEVYRGEYYASPDDPRIAEWIESNRAVWKGLVDSLGREAGISSLCDVGSGTGGFLLEYHTCYPTVKLFAVESSDAARVALKSKIPEVEFVADSAEDLKSASIKVDAVTLLQTLEHVREPKAVCSAIFDILNDGGHLLVTVPNVRSYKVFLNCDRYCFPNKTHLHFFNGKNVARLLKSVGFSSVRRVVEFGGGGMNGAGELSQYAARVLGVSSELRFIAVK